VKKMLPFTRPMIDEETIEGVAEVLRSGWLASGPKVAEFEAALSRYLGGRPVRTQTSATASMEMALLACGIGAGDEVITPAMSFVATANVIMRTRARPVFVDVDLDSRNIDLDQVEAAITPRTRAILPVHFAGLPVHMDRLYDIAKRHGLRVVEDAAHAIGSAWKGRPRLLQLSPQQKHDHHRRRGGERRVGRRGPRARAASLAWPVENPCRH
jgi:dTDP-4-amino-4,6-dideoxygalactose transaminase